jgi:hypothetical protein
MRTEFNCERTYVPDMRKITGNGQIVGIRCSYQNSSVFWVIMRRSLVKH